MTSNSLAVPPPRRSPLVTSAPLADPEPTGSARAQPCSILGTTPGSPELPAPRQHETPALTPGHLRPGGGGGGAGHSGSCGPCGRAAATRAARAHCAEQVSNAVTRTWSPLGVVVPAEEPPLRESRVRSAAEQVYTAAAGKERALQVDVQTCLPC